MNPTIEKITDDIYKGIAIRVKIAKNKMKLSRVRIMPFDPGLVSNITNNRKEKVKNPYLLTPGATSDIIKNLRFKDQYALIWGEEDELDYNLKLIFYYGLQYLKEIEPKLIEDCLLGYFPFAKYKAYADYIADFELFCRYLPDENRQSFLDTDVNQLEGKAVDRIYWQVQEKFKQRHYDFFNEKYTTKIDKELEKFITTELQSLLKELTKFKRGRVLYTFTMDLLNDFEFEKLRNEGLVKGFPANDRLFEMALDDFDLGNNYIDSKIALQARYEGEFNGVSISEPVFPEPVFLNTTAAKKLGIMKRT
ncbi:hypothetical protein SCODD09_01384 [Streptococcus constellatus]|nr:hypothetical protein SCODD09_01384 [Streptococcus constellatus]